MKQNYLPAEYENEAPWYKNKKKFPQIEAFIQQPDSSFIAFMVTFWLKLFLLQLMCLIGEGFGPYSRDVCGAVINVRAKGDKIAIWTTNTENAEAVTYIGWVGVRFEVSLILHFY